MERAADDTQGAAGGAAEPVVILGRYRLADKLGEGGFGAVYRAEHLAMGTPLAVKVLHAEHARDAKAVARFEHEARRSATLDSPHTIKVFDFGRAEDGSLFLAMELLVGRPLARVLDAGPLPPERACHVLAQILVGLAAAHGRGLVHRDLKPDNVFLVRAGADPDFVKLLDFGIAKALDGSAALTTTGSILGTPVYMAPEQCSGQDVDARADLYAVGCVAYHMLAGHPPFRSDNTLGYLLAHVQQAPAPLPDRVPIGLARWVETLLAKAPGDRFQSAEEARLELASALTGLATWRYRAAARGGLTRHESPAAAAATERAGAPRRRRWLALGALAAAVVAGGVGIALTAGGGATAPAGAPTDEQSPPEEALGDLRSARAMSARLGAQAVAQAGAMFHVSEGRPPTTVEDLVTRGFLVHSRRLDPWGRSYRLGERDGQLRACSDGPDGIPDAPGASGGDDICAQL